jgi:hypothetical protein
MMPAAESVHNEWSVIIDHEGLLELRWLGSTSTMTDGGFMATLCLFVWEAEKARPTGLLIDATDFKHTFGPGVWSGAMRTSFHGMGRRVSASSHS